MYLVASDGAMDEGHRTTRRVKQPLLLLVEAEHLHLSIGKREGLTVMLAVLNHEV